MAIDLNKNSLLGVMLQPPSGLALRGRTNAGRRERTGHNAGYHHATATKSGGMADEQSESADSTGERGELAPEDPREGSGRRV